jgi:hypothetical protein
MVSTEVGPFGIALVKCRAMPQSIMSGTRQAGPKVWPSGEAVSEAKPSGWVKPPVDLRSVAIERQSHLLKKFLFAVSITLTLPVAICQIAFCRAGT